MAIEKKRTRYEIIVAILKLCKIPQTRTRIIYGCNLNFNFLKTYEKALIEMGLLQKTEKWYKTTQRGLDTVMKANDFLMYFPKT